MPDEFDVVHLKHDDVQRILDWALATAAMALLLDSAPEGETPQETMDRLCDYVYGVGVITDNIPDILIGPASITANELVDRAEIEEAAVEQFRDEIKDL